MTSRVKNLMLLFTIALISLSCLQTGGKAALPSSTGAAIDIFTQKQPFSGKGLNASSDAFAPGEEIVIYALVTYNGFPVSSANVAFRVQGPANPIQNVTILDSAQTNDSGIASIDFRLGLLSEVFFGEWTAQGNVNIGDVVTRDFLFFRAGWMVEIVNIRTVNQNNTEQISFTRESSVGIELTLKNIAMTVKDVTLAISVYDSMGISINSTEIDYFAVPPNESLVSTTTFLFIPKSSLPGNAVIDAGVYTAPLSLGGVPYSPKVTDSFYIANTDIAILDVTSYPDAVYEGETVLINVTIENKGDLTETFNVSAFYNGTLIGAFTVAGLQPSLNVTISFEWNTSLVLSGSYQISASAGPVPGEVALSDNYFKNGIVTVKSLEHDVAIAGVSPSSTFVYIGQTVDIHVIAENNGSYTESFNVTAFYNLTAIGTLFVENLGPGDQRQLVFNWNTANVKEGNYVLSAQASRILGEKNLENNYFKDGVIKLEAAHAVLPLSILLFGLLLLLLLLILILLIILFYNRRKKKQTRKNAKLQFSNALPDCFNP